MHQSEQIRSFRPSSSARERANPYRKRIGEFPERIFLFRDFDADAQRIRCLSASRKVYCEIGSGSGGHLIGRAAREGGAVFFGFERRYKRAVRTIEKAEKLGIDNLYVCHLDAQHISEVFERLALSGVYINFPDPWPKARHRKHRLLTNAFLDFLSPLLTASGFLSVKTDVESYFNAFVRELEARNDFDISEITRDLYVSEFVMDNVQSEFEKLFFSQALPIAYLKAAKRCSSGS